MSFSGLINEAVGKFVLRSIRKGTHFSPSKEVVSPSVSLSRFSRCDFHKKKKKQRKRKIVSRRRAIGCETIPTYLAETANDCADKANIVRGMECNM